MISPAVDRADQIRLALAELAGRALALSCTPSGVSAATRDSTSTSAMIVVLVSRPCWAGPRPGEEADPGRRRRGGDQRDRGLALAAAVRAPRVEARP